MKPNKMIWNEESYLTGGWGDGDSGIELPSDITELLEDWVARTTNSERIEALEYYKSLKDANTNPCQEIPIAGLTGEVGCIGLNHLRKIKSVLEPLPIVVASFPIKINEGPYKLKEDKLDLRLLLI